MSDLHEKAVRFAVEVLGWDVEGDDLYNSHHYMMSTYDWRPQYEIQQCLDRVVPAMREYGFDLWVEPDAPASEVYHVSFVSSSTPRKIGGQCSAYVLAMAVFESACDVAGIK